MNHSNHGRQLLSAAAVVLGNAGYSLTVALFLEPAGLVAGGATGVALAFGRLTGLSVSGFLLAFNLVMLVWGWVVLGRAFALNTLASSILSPIFLGLAETMLHGRVLTDDLFLNTVFAAIGVGAFMGIVIRAGASTGGMDIPPLVLQKWFRWPVSATMLIFDIAVILIQIPFSPVPQLLYGIVAIIIQVMVLDKVLLWGESRTEVKLISTKADELCAAILHQLDRGVTILNGAGGYTHDPSAVLLSVISSRELPRLEKLVHAIDIVGQTRQDKANNIIPGVAIATALMPPLCTCGYAIANGNLRMLLGAFYLFIINAYFIYIASDLMLVLLRTPRVKAMSVSEWKRLRKKMYRNTLLVLLPIIAIAIGWNV